MTPPLKPKRTLGLKLLLGATLIVLVLMSSAFYLAYNFLAEETNTFTFEVQSNQSQLLGQRFTAVVETATNTLRVLPTLDAQTKKALENQENIKNLEVFQISKTQAAPKKVFEWGPLTLKDPPSQEIIDEVEKSGITYQALREKEGKTDVYLFSMLDSDDADSKFSVIRSKLNLAPLQKKSGGAQSQILNKSGQILLDTRNPEAEGTLINTSSPLFKAASQSPITLGTLEYQNPDSKDLHLGTYVLPGSNAMILSTIRYQDAMKGTFMLLEKMLLVGLILLGGSLVVVVIFSIRLTKPLTQLTEATNVISSGNFDLVLNENSSDEIGILSRSMNQMSRKIKELLVDSIEKVKMEQEVAIASTLQQNLIPPTDIKTPRYAIRSHYQSAKECGGDWWGIIETEKDLTLTISDATGHGLPPAMLTAAAHGCFSALQKIVQEFPELTVTPSKLLHIANQVIVDSAKSELNMTMFIATYHFETKTMTYANAGHNIPWLLRSTPSGAKKAEALRSRGSRLGEKVGFTPSDDITIPFTDEDILFLYTDGLIENTNPAGQDMDKNQIKEKLVSLAPQGIDVMSNDLNTQIHNFYQGFIAEDDVTYVMFGRTP